MDKYLKFLIGGVILILFVTVIGCFFDSEELSLQGPNHGSLHSPDGFCTSVAIPSTACKEPFSLFLLFTVLSSRLGSILPGFSRPQIHPPDIILTQPSLSDF